ncbi:hypothetical protein ACFXDE_02020 [Kitasatospora sp. NPDC059408]|uniref:hypothetical protein n=1 Tax=Kitasatospora sp. NPDC059408 TaxID=3346823 RepID=UPI0036975715
MATSLEKPQKTRAFAAPDLRPYVQPAGIGRAFGTGTMALARRLWRRELLNAAVSQARAWGIVSWPGAFCTACLTVGGWMALHRYLPAIAGALAVVWVVLALMHSTPQPAAEHPRSVPSVEAPEAAEDALEEEDEDDPREAFLDHLRRAIGNRNGVLLRDLAKEPPFDRCGIPGIRAVAAHHGIRVRDSLKVAGSTSVGIARADLPPLPQEEPQEAPLAG